MLEELANDPYKNENNIQSRSRRKTLIKYFSRELRSDMCGKVLSVGGPNPLNESLYTYTGCYVNNTGDLDLDELKSIYFSYETILCLDVLEHIFDPFHLMSIMRFSVEPRGTIYVGLPERGKLLWNKGHFHEIDDYRFRLLCKRVGLKIVSKWRYKVWRPWWQYLLGFRAFYRLFREYGVIYKLEI